MNPNPRLNPTPRHLFVATACAVTLAVTSSLAQQAPAPVGDPAKIPAADPAVPTPAQVTGEKSAAPAEQDEIITLSPFEVVANTKGYFSANTMSGTRFNTKLEDLASSITVMTKGQMSDFAMLDLNDVFLYVAGTEGTGTFTDFTLDRNGSISDNVQLNPTAANRVRGLTSANVALGNIETMNRVPIDPITIDALEISRGPNANVFGLGNPSGTVNQVAASANLQRNRVSLEMRADSYGGWRTSLDVNRVLLDGKLAVRVSGVRQFDDFVRKPSGVKTNRVNAMVKFQPFKGTTVAASIFYYDARGNRPNSLPPRDNLSYWQASGSPTWDPVTQQIHNADGTARGAPVTASTYNGPDFFTAGYLGNDRSQLWIDQGGIKYWAAPRGTTSTAGPNLPTLQAARYLQPTAAAGATFSGTAPRPFAQYLFNTTPTIYSKDIYDYSEINLSAPNRFWDRTITTNVSVDQMIISSPEQTLAAQVAFMRENSKRWNRNLVGVANDNGQSGQLTVDINERRLDGSVNPFFLRPYIGVDKPRISEQPQKWDTSRAQLAYRLDLNQKKGWTRWLGVLQLTGYSEYKYRVNRQYSFREAMTTTNTTWLPAGLYRGYQAVPAGTPALNNLTSSLYRFYVGDRGVNVDYAPGDVQYGTYNYVWGNAATGAFKTEALSFGQVAADKSGGTFNTKTVLRTLGAVAQSHLLKDRLVTTYGIRQDKTNTQYGFAGNPSNAFLLADGIDFNHERTDAWTGLYLSNSGRTTNFQVVARPFLETGAAGRMRGESAGARRFLGDLLNGLSLTYNKSSSFLPLNPAQDLYRNILPNPTGSDKSWGFGLNLLDGKLVIRATHFENIQRNAQTTDMSTMAQRVLRIDFYSVGAGNPTPYINLYNNAMHWVAFANPTWTTDQVSAQVKTLTRLSSADNSYYTSPSTPFGSAADVSSKGTELEFNYNPSRHWTMTGSVTDTRTSNNNVSGALVKWIDERLPIWTTLVDPSITDANAAAEGNPSKLWWLHRYSAAPVAGAVAPYAATAATPQDNFNSFVRAPFAIMKAQEGKSNPQVRRYQFRMSTSYQLVGISENQILKKMVVGGSFRWEDKGAIGYYGVQSLPAIVTDLDPDRPIYDKAHYYVDLFASYKTRLWGDKVAATFKLNVKNLLESSRLQPVGAFPNGDRHTYRIIEPQQIIFSMSFDL